MNGGTDSSELRRSIEAQDEDAIARLLMDESRLPGPRGNLELAAATADRLAAARRPWAIELIERWSVVGIDDAGANDPGVMLPFTAAQAAGALWPLVEDRQRGRLAFILHTAANDPRWRVREGAAMGLQRIGLADFDALKGLVSGWAENASLLGWRAIVAGLAEPSLLQMPERASYGLRMADRACEALLETPASERKTDECRALRKALGYGYSVFIAANPDGFEDLELLAKRADSDAAWIVRENLKKARIAARYPDRCAEVAALITD